MASATDEVTSAGPQINSRWDSRRGPAFSRPAGLMAGPRPTLANRLPGVGAESGLSNRQNLTVPCPAHDQRRRRNRRAAAGPRTRSPVSSHHPCKQTYSCLIFSSGRAGPLDGACRSSSTSNCADTLDVQTLTNHAGEAAVTARHLKYRLVHRRCPPPPISPWARDGALAEYVLVARPFRLCIRRAMGAG